MANTSDSQDLSGSSASSTTYINRSVRPIFRPSSPLINFGVAEGFKFNELAGTVEKTKDLSNGDK